MGLFQNIVDFYDYDLPYYRYYIYRRYLFDELKTQDKEKKVFSVYENVDYENAIDLVKECMKNAAFIGTVHLLTHSLTHLHKSTQDFYL